MTRESDRDKLQSAEDLLGYSRPLDLQERATLQEIRMDRAEKRARERGAKLGWTEVQIQEQAGKRRFWRGVGETVAKTLVMFGIKKAAAAADK